jgi:ketosteroid isomerase-like protein
MSEELTTSDPVELVRKQLEAADRGDLDGVMTSVAEDAILDGRADLVEGRAAIRGFIGEWFNAYEELNYELEEVSHLGGGVVFAVVSQDGRLVGSDGHVRQREGWVYLCAAGSITRLTTSDVDEARAAAERLAEERGQAMSQEDVEIVRRAIEAFNREDFDAALHDAAPDMTLDWSHSRGPNAGIYVGQDAIRRFWTEMIEPFEQTRFVPEEFIPHGEHVVVPITARMTGRGGIEVEAKTVAVVTFRDGRVVQWTMYQDKPEALKAVGLAE